MLTLTMEISSVTDQSLKLQIQNDMKDAMRAKETVRLGAIRMLLAAIKQKEIDDRMTLTNADVLTIINKMIKQRNESEKQFRDANRPELANKEALEITYLEHYLPEQLSESEIKKLIQEAIVSANASSVKDMGAVMNQLRSKVQGRADMGTVSAMVKAKLS